MHRLNKNCSINLLHFKALLRLWWVSCLSDFFYVNNLLSVDLKDFGLRLSFSTISHLLQNDQVCGNTFAVWCHGNETLGMKKKHSTITWRFGARRAVFCWIFTYLNRQIFRLSVICITSFSSQGGTGDSSAFLMHHEVELWPSRKIKLIPNCHWEFTYAARRTHDLNYFQLLLRGHICSILFFTRDRVE